MDKKKALSEITQEIESCPLCKKWGDGRAVSGEGNPDADILFIGEAPGKEESRTGRPFVGRSGQLLRSAIRDIGLREEEVFITSPVKYLPHRGTPVRENILHGREHLLRQLSIIKPKILVLMGSVACQGPRQHREAQRHDLSDNFSSCLCPSVPVGEESLFPGFQEAEKACAGRDEGKK
ncbi:MAG: uracil-DNA glycosylase [Candidatus Sulfobium sp.]